MKKGDTQFEVIVGTYEEFVLGYQFLLNLDDAGYEKGELTPTFATHSHRASVRSIACRGNLVVSGGADETINIYNMFTRKECGMLMEHNGTVTSLSFTPDCSHVISTSEDGSIKIFRQGSWQLEKVWPKAHKGTAVTCLAVHPSGKMALSVGKDHTLRTWNLVKGRPAYTTNLFSRCRQLEQVVWAPGGELFAVPMDCKLELTSTQKAGVLYTLEFPSKVTACSFLTDEVICVGEASGVMSAHCTQSSIQLWSLPGDQRIRGLASIHSYLVSATSNGVLSVYRMSDRTTEPLLLTSTDTGCRITCLTLYDHKRENKVKEESTDEKKAKKPDKTTSNIEKAGKRKHVSNLTETVDAITPDNSKKQKISSKSVNVMCSPRNQKWVVEDSRT